MSTQKKTSFHHIELIVGILAFGFQIIIAIIGDSGILDFLSNPDVRFEHTIPLQTNNDEFAQGIILSNKGKKPATNIVLRIDYAKATIEYSKTQDFGKTPNVLEGGNGKKFIILDIERLVGESSGDISLLLKGQEEEPKIFVAYDDGKGIKENNVYERPLVDSMAIYIGLVACLWIILDYLVVWLKIKGKSL